MGYQVNYSGEVTFSQPIPIAEFHEDGDTALPFVFDEDYIVLLDEKDGMVRGFETPDMWDGVHNGEWEQYTVPILDVCERLGVTVTGEVTWNGEDTDDLGSLYFTGTGWRAERNVMMTASDIADILGLEREYVFNKLWQVES